MVDDLFLLTIDDSYHDAEKIFSLYIKDIIVSNEFSSESNIDIAKEWLIENLLKYAANNSSVIINGKPISDIINKLINSISFKIISDSEIKGLEIGWYAYNDDDESDQNNTNQLNSEDINESIILEYGTQVGDKSIKGSSIIAKILLGQSDKSLESKLKNNMNSALTNIISEIENLEN